MNYTVGLRVAWAMIHGEDTKMRLGPFEERMIVNEVENGMLNRLSNPKKEMNLGDESLFNDIIILGRAQHRTIDSIADSMEIHRSNVCRRIKKIKACR